MTDTTNTEPPLPNADYACHYPRVDLVCSLTDVVRYGDARAAHAVAQMQGDLTKDALVDLICDSMHGVYHCNRVWEAWNVGTMSRDDFEPYSESHAPHELADAILALTATATAEQPTEPVPLQSAADALNARLMAWEASRAPTATAPAPAAKAREVTDAEIDAAIPQEIITAMTDAYWLLTKLGPVEDKRYHIVCNLAAAIALANKENAK